LKKIRFVISVYGEKYIPLLSVCLDSLSREHPDDEVTVVWCQISSLEIKLLKARFKEIEFQKQEQNINHLDIHKRIPLKLRFWAEITNYLTEEVICFLDSDTLVYKNITPYTQGDFDLIFTWENVTSPLNIGVIIVKNSQKIREFLKLWLKRTEEIVNDEELLKSACARHGAADQQALADLMDTSSYEKGIKRTFDFGTIHFKCVPCDELNQTNSVPINCGSSIFHYKAGWHPILLKGENFSIHRPKATSMEMKCFWENRYSDINEEMMKDFVIYVASNHKDILDWKSIGYEERGIIHSEMLAVLSVVKDLNVDFIIESGRARGQSTAILAEALKNSNVSIISIEWMKDENSEFAEKRLQEYSNVKLLYGDSNQEVLNIVNQVLDKKIAILFDGPKGKDAYKLFAKIITTHNNVIAGFFHDCRRSYRQMINPSRDEIYRLFDRVFFTDDEKYITQFKHLDENCIANKKQVDEHSWRPYMKGWERIGSYGPTLAVVLPTERDKERWRTSALAPSANRQSSWPIKILRRIKSILIK